MKTHLAGSFLVSSSIEKQLAEALLQQQDSGMTWDQSCMTGDREADLHCYRFYSKAETWSQAESTCRSWGSHLIAVQNEAKQVSPALGESSCCCSE